MEVTRQKIRSIRAHVDMSKKKPLQVLLLRNLAERISESIKVAIFKLFYKIPACKSMCGDHDLKFFNEDKLVYHHLIPIHF
jgi:hypothetical protein